jgi:hypothetical protein
VLFVIYSCTKCNSYRIFVGTADENRTLGILRFSEKDSFKKDKCSDDENWFREVSSGMLMLIYLNMGPIKRK